MRIKQINFLIFILPIGVVMFASSCKKDEVTNTIIQTDTVIVHDTVIINYSYIDHYNTGSSSELVSSIPIQTTNTWVQGRVIYHYLIPNLKKGNVISASVECEVSVDPNSYSYDVAVFSSIIAADNGNYLPDDPGVKEICETNGGNVTQAMHHWTITQLGTYECTSDLGDKWINFCAYAKYSSPSSGDNLIVETNNSGYGRLAIIVYRH